jgi:hypothetical protein
LYGVSSTLAIPLEDGRMLVQPTDGIPSVVTASHTMEALWSDTQSSPSFVGPIRLQDVATIGGQEWVLFALSPACSAVPQCAPTLRVAPLNDVEASISIPLAGSVTPTTRFTISDNGRIAGIVEASGGPVLMTTSFNGSGFDGPSAPKLEIGDATIVALDRSGRAVAWLSTDGSVVVQRLSDGAERDYSLPAGVSATSVRAVDLAVTDDQVHRGAVVLSTTDAVYTIDLDDGSVAQLAEPQVDTAIAAFG